VVERRGAEEPDLLLGGEDELEPRVRPPVLEHAPRRVEHRGYGGLVVGAEDRRLGVRDDPVLEDRLDRPLGRDRVEVRAEEDRHTLVTRRLEPAEEVPGGRADLGAGVVLVDVEPELVQVEGYAVGNLALLARRARQRGKVGEELDDVRNDAES
jgi:hypothetical protein